jgi:hypothetical protein
MILTLASRYQKMIAASLLTIFYLSMVMPLYSMVNHSYHNRVAVASFFSGNNYAKVTNKRNPDIVATPKNNSVADNLLSSAKKTAGKKAILKTKQLSPEIGGPSQPEMSRFKPVGADNMVNLFTGDFSYNIPLLDVGGYPVNIFYDGGITPEEEASWVGLGWNINPGAINRSMRGIPDDFNGEEKLTTTQTMKPNITWGGRLGADVELVGIKKLPANLSVSIGGTLGVSFNNYLGPALERGFKGGVSINLMQKVQPEKKTDSTLGFKLGLGINTNLSSRGGLTISPNASFTASKMITDKKSISGTLGVSTSYNSRTGIQALNLYVTGSYQKTRDDNIFFQELNKKHLGRVSKLSASISFAKPSYIPTIRMPITNEAYSGHFQLGPGIFGGYGSAEVEVYKQTSEVKPKDAVQEKPMVGYLYYQKANNNADAIVDFTRFNDKEVTHETPIVSVPQYTYDVFSINGEGTGGTIRLYRNEHGYVRDNYTKSKEKSLNIGVDIGISGHYGANVNTVNTPTTIGDWGARNGVKDVIPFTEAKDTNENVYFRNPGETSVLLNDQYSGIAGTNLVRFKLGGTKMNPRLDPVLEVFKDETLKTGEQNIQSNYNQPRKKRTQVVSYLTAEEASKIGLDKNIKSYHPETPLTADKKLNTESFSRVSGYRLKHHISQVNVTEGNGSRYVYGIPVYNLKQYDFTFTIGSPASPDADFAQFANQNLTTGSEFLQKNSPKDGYLQTNQTPEYAHSFLLSGLLSPDYVDVTGDGITEDDQGGAVKFNYTRIKKSDGEWAVHKWRTPHTGNQNEAAFNAGNRTNLKDDKGMISYGERENWYLHSIESKTMIAFFTLESRLDGKGALGIDGGIEPENALRLLRKIDLYNKADLKKNGIANAKPVKTVHFDYSYKLCVGSAGNPSANKLTLDGIYFTFNGKNRNNKNQYKFAYEHTVNNVTTGNPNYGINVTDRWGTYKPASLNPAGLKNADYPYSYQPANNTEREIMNQNAGAWNLKKILLPSGGQIEVDYESDDYAFVQNRRASVMMNVAGFSKDGNVFSNSLYKFTSFNFVENLYVLINVPEACNTAAEVYTKYLQGQEQLAFKLAVEMPKGIEYLTSYAFIDGYGIPGTPGPNNKQIWIKLKPVEKTDLSPLSVTAIEFLKEQLPGQAFPGYDVSEGTAMQQVGSMLMGMLYGLRTAFSDPVKYLRTKGLARETDLSKCFVRLNDPDGIKYGGGYRVKKILLKDNWQAMTQQFTSAYGTEYDYTTTEKFNNQDRVISSGVASYEPSIGGEENPFQTMVQVTDKLSLGPSSYGAVEMPVLDAFFPAPVVGYSKVTVRSMRKGNIPQGMKSRSVIGKQVTEFYTAKDFPVIYRHTSLDAGESNWQATNRSLGSFWFKWQDERRTLTQGFLVAVNDMHGKMRKQSSYAENDPSTPLSYTENFYRNTGTKGLDEKFDFVYASQGGKIEEGNMGIDIELMTDTREFTVKGVSREMQAQLDWFPAFAGLPWLPFIWYVQTRTQSTYRAVTCTKVINYHSIVDSVIVVEKGSKVKTENLVFDAETGEVVVNRHNNEYGKQVYTTTYPAWWAYSGMGLAYKNIDAIYTNLNFRDGKIINKTPAEQSEMLFESGDELYVVFPGTQLSDACSPFLNNLNPDLLWVFNKNKNLNSLTDPNPEFVFMDERGRLFTKNNVSIRIVRSGRRNMLNATVAGTTSLVSPVFENSGTKFLKMDGTKKVLNASAVEYAEKWQTDNDVFRKYKTIQATSTPAELVVNGDFSAGNTGFNTDYFYSPANNSALSGRYRVSPSSGGWFSGAVNCNNGGNYLQIDGGQSFNRVWYQTLQVIPNTQYTFSAYIASINNGSNANVVGRIQLMINDQGIDPVFDAFAAQCNWRKAEIIWNSGSSTSVTIGIRNIDWSVQGNDYIIDDISFKAAPECSEQEVEDCTGYLEKSINPYVKGLLGTFRPYRSMVFYDKRAEENPATQTDLPNNGFLLSSFKQYWDFNTIHNLVPDVTNPKWVWNSQVTRMNSKGMELETRDALEIYTSAQYGYNKTLPVAITNNSSYKEMFYDGFEDDSYDETINPSNSTDTCGKKHISFKGLENGTILKANTEIGRAHTGNNVMKITPNTSVTKKLPINFHPFYFDLNLSTGYSANNLIDPGGKFTPLYIWDFWTGQYIINYFFPSHLFASINLNSVVQPAPFPNGNNNSSFINLGAYHSQSGIPNPFPNTPIYKTIAPGVSTQYINIEQPGYYYFTVGQSNLFAQTPAAHSAYNYGKLIISNINKKEKVGEYLSPDTMVVSSSSTTGAANAYSAFLCKGIYELAFLVYQKNEVSQNLTGSTVYYTCNQNLVSYQNIDIQSNCIYTKPIPASPTMMNPTFSITPEKKMLFSAWVREATFKANGYTNTEVQLLVNGNSVSDGQIKPSGPVIEGWQRIEGTFTAPSGATEMTLRFVNSSGQPVYFDDIRIHPFNANMKSYVYDPVNLRLLSELDANNYASYYEYDEEGQLIRTKAETKEGIKTIRETRSAKQKTITQLQQ